MREIVRYGLTLASICAVATGSLAAVNSLTRPKIIAQARAEEDAGLKEVLPDAENFQPVKSGEEIIYYKACGKEGRFIGAAFKASAKGYSSVIEVLAGMTDKGVITAIKILSQNETPGLGAGVAEPSFTGRFVNKDIRDLNNVEAISGATISSQAVIEAVKKKAEEIEALLKNEK